MNLNIIEIENYLKGFQHAENNFYRENKIPEKISSVQNITNNYFIVNTKENNNIISNCENEFILNKFKNTKSINNTINNFNQKNTKDNKEQKFIGKKFFDRVFKASNSVPKQNQFILNQKKIKNKKIVYAINKKNSYDHIKYNKRILNKTKIIIPYKSGDIFRIEKFSKIRLRKFRECLNISKHNEKRSSKYRGVSKNGSLWQVLIMTNRKIKYFGPYET